MYQKLWGTAKTGLKGKFIAMYAYIKKGKRSRINPTSQLRELEIEETEPKAGRKKILNIRAEIKYRIKKQQAKINEMSFFILSGTKGAALSH